MSKQLNTSYNWDFIPIRVLFACFGILFAITLLSAIILASSRVSANNSAVDDVAITVPTACSMGGVVDTAHSATLQGGTYSAASGSDYQNGIGKTTLTTFCNDYNGFSIYAIGFTDNQEGTNTLVGTDIPTNTITTKVYESTDTASNWSMRVTKVNDSTVAYNPANMNITNSFDSWHVVPSTYAKVAEYHAQTGSSATDAEGGLGAKVETTYASYISTTQPADTYTGQVKYVMVHPYSLVAGTYTIAYNANGGSGTMTSETNIPNYDEHTLAANTFTAPSGYQFAGWCTVQDQTQTPQTTCSGTSYADEGTVLSSTFDSNTVVNLYAYWRETYMQDVATWGSTLAIGDEMQAVDSRDGKTYYVAKLDDGNIWMTQNLDLCIGCTGTATLTSENTDLTVAGTGIYTNGYITSQSGVITWTPSGSTMQGTPAEITNFAPGSPANSVTGWTNDNTAPYMAEGGAHWVANNTTYSNRSTCVGANGAVACDHGQVGNYYNWTAAIASNGSGAVTAKYTDAANSICPKGWGLPDGPDGTNGSEFNALLSTADIANGVDNGSGGSAVNVGFKNDGRAKMENTPYYFIRSGYVGGTTFGYLTAYGSYWSRSAVSGSGAFALLYGGTVLYPAGQYSRDNGRSVRCVAQ